MYRVELWSAPMPWPLTFAVHTWFVIESNEEKSRHRYEVWATLGRFSGVTVHIDALEPSQGFRTSFFDNVKNPRHVSTATKLGVTEGGENSPAHALYMVIKGSTVAYPGLNEYRLWPGPNSNSYTAWALAQVLRTGLDIPAGAYGAKWYTKA